MNFLKQNLNNSLTLPFEIMKLIYEYADPIRHIRKQIENNEYKLNDDICFFYNRDNFICGLNTYYFCYYRSKMIKDLQCKRDFEYTNGITTKYINYQNYSTKTLYKLWLKL